MTIPHRIRLARESDDDFIIAHWMESLHADAPGFACVRWRDMKGAVREDIRASLEHDLVHVACDPDDDDRLLGFIATRPAPHTHTLLYGFVRKRLRGQGIGLDLLVAAESLRGPVTHYLTRTKEGLKWARKRSWSMVAARAA